jgi:hypothetical protein
MKLSDPIYMDGTKENDCPTPPPEKMDNIIEKCVIDIERYRAYSI